MKDRPKIPKRPPPKTPPKSHLKTSHKAKRVTFAETNTIVEIERDPEERDQKKQAIYSININLLYSLVLRGKYAEALKFLNSHKIVDIDRPFSNSITILHLAFFKTMETDSENLLNLIEGLLARGASIELLDGYHNYPLSYSSSSALESLMSTVLDFVNLSEGIIYQNIISLTSLSISLHYESLLELYSFVDRAYEQNFKIKIFSKTNQSFFETISFFLRLFMHIDISSSDLRNNIIDEIILDSELLGLDESIINQLRDPNSPPNPLVKKYTSKLFMVIINIIHTDGEYEWINFYSSIPEISISMDFTVFEDSGYYFPVIDTIIDDDSSSSNGSDVHLENFLRNYRSPTDVPPPTYASEYDILPSNSSSSSSSAAIFEETSSGIGGIAEAFSSGTY